MTDPFAMRSLCAFKSVYRGPNYHFNNSTDDNAPSVNQHPSLAFASKDNTNYFVPSSEAPYTIHKVLNNPHEQKVCIEDKEKVIEAGASPKESLQKGRGQVDPNILSAFEHPVMKTTKMSLTSQGSGKVSKVSGKVIKKGSKIRYV